MSGTSDAAVVLKNRFLWFFVWQAILSAIIFILSKYLILSAFTINPFIPSLATFLAFLSFLLSMALFAIPIDLISTPKPCRPASVIEVVVLILRFYFAGSLPPLDRDFRLRLSVSMGIVAIVCATVASGSFAVFSVLVGGYSGSLLESARAVGVRGYGFGLVYGLHYVFRQRWVLAFPITQHPTFFSFKMGIPSTITQALKLSSVAYLFSTALGLLFWAQHKYWCTQWCVIRSVLAEQFVFYTGSFMVILCWELIHHLHKVLRTKRLIFAPPKGSAAAETNPSGPLLAALEESPSGSLMQYLAYLDLSKICETNIETWRRAAFFEETGETYNRIVAACLRPLEQLASKLGEGLSSMDDLYQLSLQLSSPKDIHQNPAIVESFNDFQLYAWCAHSAASLTVHSHKEDRFGVAQLSGSHAAALSTLLSCLLAVETVMGKKTNLQSAMLGHAGIKWAINSSARREIAVAMNKKKDSSLKDSCLYSKAYSLADVFKISIYSIVYEFHEEMERSAKAGLLGKVWLISGKPIYGSHDLLMQKLQLFLDFWA
ncbi:hypothetical protein Ancab_012680 [Ancistrocladus abbreviatus]